MINKTNKSIIIFFTFAFGFFLSNLLRSITATLTPVLTNDFDDRRRRLIVNHSFAKLAIIINPF